MPLFSIITPCYNSAKWIGRCIESITVANRDADYEFIIIDDGSSDDTFAICSKYAHEESRIRLFSRENRGYCATMNELVSLSKGHFIVSLDSDNWLSDNCLIELQRIFSDRPDLDFIQFPTVNHDFVLNTTKVLNQRETDEYLCSRQDIERAISSRSINLSTHGAKAIKRDLFLDCVRFSGDPAGADGRVMERISFLSRRVLLINQRISLHVEMRDSSLSNIARDPGFWLRYLKEEINAFSLFETHRGCATMPIAELTKTYDIYTFILTKASIGFICRHRSIGFAVWRRRRELVAGGAKRRIKQFVCCFFPCTAHLFISAATK